MRFSIPFSLFLAIILSFGRLISDNELPVLLASGFSWQKLLNVGLLFSLGVVLITTILNLWVVPYSNYLSEKTMATQEPGMLADSLVKGRFYSFNHDKLVFYIKEISPNKRVLSQVFIAQQSKPSPESKLTPWAIITADKGEIKLNDQNKYAYIELTNGTRLEVMLHGKQDYDIIILWLLSSFN